MAYLAFYALSIVPTKDVNVSVIYFVAVSPNSKVKLSHYRPGHEVEAPENVLSLSALRTARLYPQEGFLILISIRG
jgi:hypothetical protein